jgi:hypothetical protein
MVINSFGIKRIFIKMKIFFLFLALIYFLKIVSCELNLKGTFKAHYSEITSLEISDDGDIALTSI